MTRKTITGYLDNDTSTKFNKIKKTNDNPLTNYNLLADLINTLHNAISKKKDGSCNSSCITTKPQKGRNRKQIATKKYNELYLEEIQKELKSPTINQCISTAIHTAHTMLNKNCDNKCLPAYLHHDNKNYFLMHTNNFKKRDYDNAQYIIRKKQFHFNYQAIKYALQFTRSCLEHELVSSHELVKAEAQS